MYSQVVEVALAKFAKALKEMEECINRTSIEIATIAQIILLFLKPKLKQ
jgi:hypothetical protein